MSDDYIMCPLEKGLRIAHARLIYDRIRAHAIHNPYAREATVAFLALFPITELPDAKIKMRYYVEKYPDFSSLLEQVKKLEDEEKTKEIIDTMHEHLKNNQVDAALDAARKHVAL